MCHFSMDDITSGRVFVKVPEYSQCDGVFMVKPGFGVRYRFSGKDLAKSERLISQAMTLFDSWIVER